MFNIVFTIHIGVAFFALSSRTVVKASYHSNGKVYNENLLRDVMTRLGNGLVDPPSDYDELPSYSGYSNGLPLTLRDGGIMSDPSSSYSELSMSPSLRDREYLAHSSLMGNLLAYDPNIQIQRPKPNEMEINGGMNPDGPLPSYCNPPNPCPLGYTAKDDCLEDFENTAGFSRDYQAMQNCICDSEHMFQCPHSSQESKLEALARSIQNEGNMDYALDNIMAQLNPNNPLLDGEKLPIAAKKGKRW